ncbi:MAG: PAS domain S-box protein [Myxococcales bacterium]|nr:PAS domain S-box protein [Myxococcales bacterium]
MDTDELDQPRPRGSELLARELDAALLAVIRDAIVAIDDAQRVLYCNAATERMLGWRTDELRGGHIGRLLVDRDALATLSPDDDAAPGARHELRLRHKRGHIVLVACAASRLPREAGRGVVLSLHDITERRAVEAELRASAERYRSVIAAMSEGVVLHAPDGSIVQSNESAARLLGLTEAQMTGRDSMDPRWRAVRSDGAPYPGDQHPAMLTLRTGEPISGARMGVRRPDDGLVWISINTQPVVMPSFGSRHGVVATFTDVTARVHAEERLRASEERYRALVRNVPGVVYRGRLVGERVESTYIDTSISELTGYPIADIRSGRVTLVEVLHPDDRRATLDLIRAVVSRDATFSIDYRILRADGEVRWILDQGHVIRDDDGQPLWVDGVMIDITARKVAERELAESSRRLQLAARAAGVAIWHLNATADALHWDELMGRIYGLAPDEFPRTRAAWLARLHPDDRPPPGSEERDALFIAAGQETFRVVRPDGAVRHVHSACTTARDDDGTLRVFGTHRDITDEIEAAVERERLHRELMDSQRLEALGVLAGGVAHDVNNALTTIVGFAELARRGARDDSQLARYLDHVLEAGWRTQRLAQQVLTFSRRAPPRFAALDLRQLTLETLTELRASMPPQVELTWSLGEAPAPIEGNESLLRHALVNLCTNAHQAISGPGEVHVALRVTEDDGCSCGAVTLLVRDTGHGIAPELRARVFDPFFTTRRAEENTGLGLAVVRGIVRRHGGRVSVTESDADGTELQVTFQRAEPDDLVSTSPPPRDDVERGAVLFVDDEAQIVSLARELLREDGFNVTGAYTPEDALARLHAPGARFDVAVVDFNMPGQNGLEVARRVQELRPGLPIILVSGRLDEALRERAGRLGIRVTLSKPFRRDALLDALRRARA